MSEHVLRDTGEPVPSFDETQRLLGPELSGLIEQRLGQLNAATCPMQINTLCGYLQGLYNAAGLLGRIDKCLARALGKAVLLAAQGRLSELSGGVATSQHIGEAVKQRTH